MALVMTLTLVWRLPEITWTSPLLAGAQVTLRITPNMMEGMLALITSLVVTDSIIQIHPRLGHLALYWRVTRYWPVYCLPAALALVVVVAQPLSVLPTVSVFAMLVAIGAYTFIQFLLYESQEPSHPHAGQFIFLLHGMAYITAFLLFLLVHHVQARPLLAAAMITGTSFLVTIELLRHTTPDRIRLLRYALGITLIISLAGMILILSGLSDLAHGVLLIWFFFLLVNISQNYIQQQIRRTQWLEYGIFSVFSLLLIYLIETNSLQLWGP